ncbi:hypothetical protein HYPGJ_30178 [Hyphomicrobium sp. GJ21]|nr:hypothetical protein HYPGJ_30178 [Hyphomicrobium sp. GJ21]
MCDKGRCGRGDKARRHSCRSFGSLCGSCELFVLRRSGRNWLRRCGRGREAHRFDGLNRRRGVSCLGRRACVQKRCRFVAGAFGSPGRLTESTQYKTEGEDEEQSPHKNFRFHDSPPSATGVSSVNRKCPSTQKRAMPPKGQYLRHAARKFITEASRKKRKGAKFAPFPVTSLIRR